MEFFNKARMVIQGNKTQILLGAYIAFVGYQGMASQMGVTQDDVEKMLVGAMGITVKAFLNRVFGQNS